MAQPKRHELPPDWLVPFAPGKQFVIPDTVEQYKQSICDDTFHFFLGTARRCKCGDFFWPDTDQYNNRGSRVIRIPMNPQK